MPKFENDIMSRRTFNEDLLFKKKPAVMVEKPARKPLFDNNDEEEEEFVIKK